ncbi:RNA polymerase factor sigma-54, partial [Escherichia coli]
ECLMVQLKILPPETPSLKEALAIADQHLALLGNRDFRTLGRVTKLKEEALKSAIDLIQSLEPRPGLVVNTGESEYVIPDVLVRKHGERWTV